MTEVIPLIEQLKGLHPKTGKPVTVVGIDASSAIPRLVVLSRGPDGIFAEVIDYADHPGGA